MKKIVLIPLITLICTFLFFNKITINASYSVTPFTAPIEWGNMWGSTSWIATNEDDLVVSNNKVLRTCNPFFEHKYTIYKIEDNYHGGYYIAILIDMYINPNNFSGKKCKSSIVTVDSFVESSYYGYLFDGGPVATSNTTSVTTSIGGGAQVGHNGESFEGSISANFERSVTQNIPDLDVYGARIKKYSSNPNVTEFIAYFDFYDPYRNDCNYLSSSVPLQYGAIYHIGWIGRASVKINYNIDLIWDGNAFEGNHTASISDSVTVEFSMNLNHLKFYI